MGKNVFRYWIIPISTFITASLSLGKPVELAVTGMHFTIPDTANRNLSTTIEALDGDIFVVGTKDGDATLEISDFDLEDNESNRASVYYDAEEGTVRVKLWGKLRESDLRLTLPNQSSIDANAKDGDLFVEYIEGNLNLTAVDGDISATEVAGPARIEATDGDIYIELANTDVKKEISAMSVDGDIIIRMSRDSSINLSLSAVDGDLKSEIPLASKGGAKSEIITIGDEAKLDIALNGGGPSVSLRSIDGDIVIKDK